MSRWRSSAPYRGDKHPLNLAEIASRQKSSKVRKNTFRKIMITEEGNQRKLQDWKLRNFREIFEEHSTRKIIDFESGRMALKKVDFDDEQNGVELMERSSVPSGLPVDWLEFLLTAGFFVLLLLGLVGGVVASWRF
jgi:hypothetical protein